VYLEDLTFCYFTSHYRELFGYSRLFLSWNSFNV